MRLFEFAGDDPLRVKLTAIAAQLESRVTETGQTMSTDEFLNILSDKGITIDISDLFDLVKKDPLKNIIDNVNKNEIVFKSQAPDEQEGAEPDADEMAKTRAQMASKQVG
jgi:hypothetical protein